MRINIPLWSEGLILSQQHFQQLQHWLEHYSWNLSYACASVTELWGIERVLLDEAALTTGRLKVDRLQLVLPDGTLIDSTVSDRLPPARDLSQVSPDILTLTVFAALPLLEAVGNNCRFDEAPLVRPRRYYREFVNVADQFGDDEVEFAAARHAVHLLFDFESREDHAACPIARLVRGPDGQFIVDYRYVPPCITLDAHVQHVTRVHRIADILAARSSTLAERRNERVGQVAEYGIADVSLFWLLHCIHSAWPQLNFLGTHPHQPVERLYPVLAQLTSTLTTFSTRYGLTDIPAYDHLRQDEVFARLEAMIRELLDAIIPSRVVPLGLTKKSATTWEAQILDDRLTTEVDYYLSVSACLPAFDLVEQIPKLCKVGSPDDVNLIVNAAIGGIPLRAVQRVPAAIPVRLDNQYFALDGHDAGLSRMLAARACRAYLPTVIPDASLELYAVLRS